MLASEALLALGLNALLILPLATTSIQPVSHLHAGNHANAMGLCLHKMLCSDWNFVSL